MKTKRIHFIAFVIAIITFATSAFAQTTRSYMTFQILTQSAYGPIVEVPQNQGGWVTWSADGKNISMSDGTNWRYQQDVNGFHHYLYVENNGYAMPNTQYNSVVFNSDYTTMAIFYSFGMPGMMIQMRSDWKYIGEGTQPANDWITGNF